MTRDQVQSAIDVLTSTRTASRPEDIAAGFLVGIAYAALVLERSETDFEELVDIAAGLADDYRAEGGGTE